MSTPPITPAHIELLRKIGETIDKWAGDPDAITTICSRLIAESEAKAILEETWRADAGWVKVRELTAERDAARAERAETELTKERARLDWVLEFCESRYLKNPTIPTDTRDSIDSAMKE